MAVNRHTPAKRGGNDIVTPGGLVSDWDDFGMQELVLRILRKHAGDAGQHLGRPYMTADQIALALKQQYGELFLRLGMPLGGDGTEARPSLAGYIDRQLTQKLKARGRDVEGILEGAALSGRHLDQLRFRDGEAEGISAVPSPCGEVLMYRFIG